LLGTDPPLQPAASSPLLYDVGYPEQALKRCGEARSDPDSRG